MEIFILVPSFPCSCCGNLMRPTPDLKDGGVGICVHCGHLILYTQGVLRDLDKFELSDPENQACLQQMKDFQQKRCHELGLWG